MYFQPVHYDFTSLFRKIPSRRQDDDIIAAMLQILYNATYAIQMILSLTISTPREDSPEQAIPIIAAILDKLHAVGFIIQGYCTLAPLPCYLCLSNVVH